MMVNPEHCHLPDKPGGGSVGESQQAVKSDFFLKYRLRREGEDFLF